MKTSVLALPLLAATAARAVPLPAPTFGGAAMWDPMFWMKKWGNMLGGDAGLSGMGDLSKWANMFSPTGSSGSSDSSSSDSSSSDSSSSDSSSSDSSSSDSSSSDSSSSSGLGEISKWIKYAHDTLSAFTPTGSTSSPTDDSTSSSGSIPSSTSESSSSYTDGSTGTSTSTGSGGGSGLAALEKIASQVMVLVALNMHTTLTQAMLHPSAYMTGSKGSGADSTANTAGESTGSTSGASNSARLIRGLNTTPPTGGSSGTTVSKAVVSGSTPATEAQRASKANALARDKVSVQGRTQKAALNKTTTPTVPTTGTTA
ncbi:hypothetical protein MVLG_00259 [Microbotryum lychnidis-dioicae p1A1 Lamole]|uniref:REJ domain-containing protein n=1 Tax=Microbotryum lychnidis-dioicae (strain p1A1 Lamole / MvSl-1064) TaxID=683840 RepID=U5GYJ2_USTV1|nr:hypothetical protein MVLG_00259 [Microbotryum lychnidis-dioicae p1A1 Lamole]|eukprot:KDE09861.1 hypothetical protein MVLG_00259 [Microbotryum lychnidis-dioicae p1A1 Lamole]